MSVQHRHVAWCLARQKVPEGGQEPVYPDPAVEEVVKRIVSAILYLFVELNHEFIFL